MKEAFINELKEVFKSTMIFLAIATVIYLMF